MLTLAKDSQAPRLSRHTIFSYRLVLAVVWAFWGVRDGILLRSFEANAHGSLLTGSLGITKPILSMVIGVLMLGMAFWLVAGWACRMAAVVQLVGLFFLWWLGFQGGAKWMGTLLEQLPMIALVLTVWAYGPGTCVWKKARHGTTWTRG